MAFITYMNLTLPKTNIKGIFFPHQKKSTHIKVIEEQD